MQLFTELRRRNVFRVSLGYIVSCWLLAQVADLVLENIGAPDWVIQTILLLIALGFPVVVFFSWAYEVTPEGIKRESEIDRSQSVTHVTGRKLDYSILVVLVAALGFMVWESRFQEKDRTQALLTTETVTAKKAEPEPRSAQTVDPSSIAVLPFADLSQSGDQDYFSDGIAEEILNVLVRVDGLSVASRTSAFGFKGQESLGIPAIAEALKVRNVLEGSVRTAGDKVRITAQLIDAQTDKHRWSQTYDRVLSAENLFAIQDEIARAIVAELSRAMEMEKPAVDEPMVTPTTGSLDAYQLYLKARDLYRRRTADNIPTIIDMLNQALELDPEYATAWAGLAAVTTIAPSWGVGGEEFKQIAFDAASRAIELDDSLALSYAVLGLQACNEIPADFARCFAYYDQALQRNPKAVNALLWRGIHLLAVGMFDAAEADLRRCLEIDPAYDNCRRWLALNTLFQGDTETALKLFESGVVRGSTAQADNFVFAYFDEGDSRAGLLAMAWLLDDTDTAMFSLETLVRAFSDPEFNHELELQKASLEYKAKTGLNLLDEDISAFAAVAFKRYDLIVASPFLHFYWNPHLPGLLASAHSKRLLRDLGVYDYWISVGFPPQCRPLGEDDFECD